MYTRRLDAALHVIAACELHLPELASLYPDEGPQQRAIRSALTAVEQMKAAVFGAAAGSAISEPEGEGATTSSRCG